MKFSKSLTIIVLIGLFLPLISLAAIYEINGKTVIHDGGLIPCGREACIIHTTSSNAIRQAIKVIEVLQTPPPHGANYSFGQACASTMMQVVVRSEWREKLPCQLCHLFVMLDILIDFALTYIVFPVASLLIIFSGGTLMFSSGDPGKIGQGKKILFSTVIGLIIIFSAWLIVNEFMRAIGVANWTGIGDGWWTIHCPI